jgi:hypothetical protein
MAIFGITFGAVLAAGGGAAGGGGGGATRVTTSRLSFNRGSKNMMLAHTIPTNMAAYTPIVVRNSGPAFDRRLAEEDSTRFSNIYLPPSNADRYKARIYLNLLRWRTGRD